MKLKHVLSSEQFTDKKFMNSLFASASNLEKLEKKGKTGNLLKGKILATIFYEPSTRTRLSFEAAMLKLGGQVVSAESASQFSSAKKGESLEDTIKIISGYADAVVLRHPEIGSAQKASEVSDVPIINAGDGQGEHPTQALLDLYTIKKEIGSLDNKTIAFIGDLLYGRTIHSLIHFMPMFKNVHVKLISPKQLKLPEKYKHILIKNKISFVESESLIALDSSVSVAYITRVQKERFDSEEEYEEVKDVCVVDASVLNKLGKNAIIMHPLPRVNEISPEIDTDKRAAYFRQAKNGLYVRMALLKMLLG